MPLAGPANRQVGWWPWRAAHTAQTNAHTDAQGRIAADTIRGRDSRFRGIQATAICGAFGVVMAQTGASTRSLERAGVKFSAVHLHPGSHVTYFPGAKRIDLKVGHASPPARDDPALLTRRARIRCSLKTRRDVCWARRPRAARASPSASTRLPPPFRRARACTAAAALACVALMDLPRTA